LTSREHALQLRPLSSKILTRDLRNGHLGECPKQLAEDCRLAQGTHDLATAESRCEYGAYLESKYSHIVVLHSL